MKKFIFLILFLISGFAFSQVQQSNKTESEVNYKVDRAAEFPGGIDVFRTKFVENFQSKKLISSGKIRTEITFVVERDGTISDIKAVGNNESFNIEAINSIKKIKDVWIPATINGQKLDTVTDFL